MMFAGDTKAIGNIENNAYPLGTKLNELFEVIVHPQFPGGGFALEKRTGKLKDLELLRRGNF